MSQPAWCSDNPFYRVVCWLHEQRGEPIPPTPPIIPRDELLIDVIQPPEWEMIERGNMTPQNLTAIARRYFDAGAPTLALRISEAIPEMVAEINDDEDVAMVLRSVYSLQHQALEHLGQEQAARIPARMSRMIDHLLTRATSGS